MISPLLIIGVALGGAFSLGIVRKLGKEVSFVFTLLVLAAMTFVSGWWAFGLLFGDLLEQTVSTAGGRAPFVIVFEMGVHEALFSSMVNVIGLLGAFYLHDRFKRSGYGAMAVYIAAVMGMNGLILTGDIFNLFVFMEIATIGTIGLVILVSEHRALAAAFKYMMAAGLISGLLLLGIVFLYSGAGTLNIAQLATVEPSLIKGGAVAIFLVMIAVILELKPFPANGWGIDLYDGAPAGVSALISAGSATAAYFVLLKLLPLGGAFWYQAAAVIGLTTFVTANLMALVHTNTRRLLGYSSIGQLGLLTGIAGLAPTLGEGSTFIILTILVTHYLAKAGLFWISGVVRKKDTKDWGVLRKSPLLFVLFGVFVFALVGFPPFPSFFGKWELVMGLVSRELYWWAGAVLLGTMLEGIYLFRWYSNALKLENDHLEKPPFSFFKVLPTTLVGLALFGFGWYANEISGHIGPMGFIPLLFIALLGLLEFLPAVAKNILSLIGIGAYILYLYPSRRGRPLQVDLRRGLPRWRRDRSARRLLPAG